MTKRDQFRQKLARVRGLEVRAPNGDLGVVDIPTFHNGRVGIKPNDGSLTMHWDVEDVVDANILIEDNEPSSAPLRRPNGR